MDIHFLQTVVDVQTVTGCCGHTDTIQSVSDHRAVLCNGDSFVSPDDIPVLVGQHQRTAGAGDGIRLYQLNIRARVILLQQVQTGVRVSHQSRVIPWVSQRHLNVTSAACLEIPTIAAESPGTGNQRPRLQNTIRLCRTGQGDIQRQGAAIKGQSVSLLNPVAHRGGVTGTGHQHGVCQCRGVIAGQGEGAVFQVSDPGEGGAGRRSKIKRVCG